MLLAMAFLGTIALFLSEPLGCAVLLAMGAIVARDVIEALAEALFGVELRMPSFDECRGEGVFVLREGGRYRVGAGLVVREVRRSVLDCDPYDWLASCKAALDGVITDPAVEYSVAYVRSGPNARYVFRAVVEGEDPTQIEARLLETLRRAKRALESAGAVVGVAGVNDLRLPVRMSRPRSPGLTAALCALAAAGVVCAAAWTGRLALLAASLYAALCVGLAALCGLRGERYRLDGAVVAVREDLAAYHSIAPHELHKYGVSLHNALNRGAGDLVLVMRLRPLGGGGIDEIKAKYYSKLKWGEAMGKYEMLDEARKYAGLIERRNRGELIYEARMAVIVGSREEARQIAAILESVGLKAYFPLVKSRVLRSLLY